MEWLFFIQMLECEFADETWSCSRTSWLLLPHQSDGVRSSSWWDSSGKRERKAPETTHPEDDRVFSLEDWDKLISAGDFRLVQWAEAAQHPDVAFSVHVRHRGGDRKVTRVHKWEETQSSRFTWGRKEPVLRFPHAEPHRWAKHLYEWTTSFKRNRQTNMKQRQNKWRASLLCANRSVQNIRRGVTEESKGVRCVWMVAGFSEACLASLPSEWGRGSHPLSSASRSREELPLGPLFSSTNGLYSTKCLTF